MQAIILCAGMGKRISKQVDYSPKCLLEIDGRPIIKRQIELLSEFSSTAPILVVGYMEERVRDSLKGENVIFVRNPEYETTNILMSLWYGLNKTQALDDIICLPGDLVFDRQVLLNLKKSEFPVTVAIQRKQCDEEAVKVILKDDVVVGIGKNLSIDSSIGEFLGIFRTSNTLVSGLRQEVDRLIGSGEKNSYMFTAIQSLIDKGVTVKYLDIGDTLWEEIDYFDDYIRAKDKFGFQNG